MQAKKITRKFVLRQYAVYQRLSKWVKLTFCCFALFFLDIGVQ